MERFNHAVMVNLINHVTRLICIPFKLIDIYINTCGYRQIGPILTVVVGRYCQITIGSGDNTLADPARVFRLGHRAFQHGIGFPITHVGKAGIWRYANRFRYEILGWDIGLLIGRHKRHCGTSGLSSPGICIGDFFHHFTAAREVQRAHIVPSGRSCLANRNRNSRLRTIMIHNEIHCLSIILIRHYPIVQFIITSRNAGSVVVECGTFILAESCHSAIIVLQAR